VASEEGWENEASMYFDVYFVPTLTNSLHQYLRFYLQYGTTHKQLNLNGKIDARIKYTQDTMVEGVLFRKNYDKVLLSCLNIKMLKGP
jgi:hypothetical protein